MVCVSLQALIQAGQTGDRLISFPTDTVPALACRPDAAAMIYEAKQRSQTKPLILMGGHEDELWAYVQHDHPAFSLWQQITFGYWPGALTLVVPASDRLPQAVNPTNPTTIGIRVPNCAIARHILSHTGPLATTSINRSGTPPLESIDAINREFPGVLTLSSAELHQWHYPETANITPIPQQHQSNRELHTEMSDLLSAGTPSTVIKWTDQGWVVLRQGAIVLPSALNADAQSS